MHLISTYYMDYTEINCVRHVFTILADIILQF
jgi:hypothetical protein